MYATQSKDKFGAASAQEIERSPTEAAYPSPITLPVFGSTRCTRRQTRLSINDIRSPNGEPYLLLAG